MESDEVIYFQNYIYRAQIYSSPTKANTSGCEVSCFIQLIISNKKQILINHTRGKTDLSFYSLPIKKNMKLLS